MIIIKKESTILFATIKVRQIIDIVIAPLTLWSFRVRLWWNHHNLFCQVPFHSNSWQDKKTLFFDVSLSIKNERWHTNNRVIGKIITMALTGNSKNQRYYCYYYAQTKLYESVLPREQLAHTTIKTVVNGAGQRERESAHTYVPKKFLGKAYIIHCLGVCVCVCVCVCTH